jgi:hypothetical protein
VCSSITSNLTSRSPNFELSPAFKINYPQSGDLVNVYNGLNTMWSYNSSDSILLPLTIQFVAASHREESPAYTSEDLNITIGIFTIETTFTLADHYLLRFIYGNNYYETGHFDLTVSELSKNASERLSSASPLAQSTLLPSILVLPATESTATGTSSLAQETHSPSDSKATANVTETPIRSENSDDDLNTGAKVGIGIGCSAAVIIGMVGFFILRRIRKSKIGPEEPPSPPNVGLEMELDGSSATRKKFERDAKHGAASMPVLRSLPSPSIELHG